ncbi:MAG: hypothetical protein BAJALOKI2v1_560013 [Promethearchaeota archaeon]|nr:MAG: hypothetical protein BAJALOKI2v1_560013 [Candidatus Lokiarchaeota archaeon]
MMREEKEGQNNDDPSKKILILGLDNAGKTSIVLSLKGYKNLLTFYSLTPTKGIDIVNIDALNSRFNIWDFGGQEVYRNGYLENFGDHMTGVEKIIYVIDVQDNERYDIALEYLNKIVEKLESDDLDLDFSIFLHKYDPGVKINSGSLKDLIDNIVGIMDEDEIDYEIYKTTIYTTFSKTPIFID